MLLAMHRIAKCYGKWPHEVMELDPMEMALAFAAMNEAKAFAQNVASRGMVFPIVDVGA